MITIEMMTEEAPLRLHLTCSEPLFTQAPGLQELRLGDSISVLERLFADTRTPQCYILLLFFGSIRDVRLITGAGNPLHKLIFEANDKPTFNRLCGAWQRPFKLPGSVSTGENLAEVFALQGFAETHFSFSAT